MVRSLKLGALAIVALFTLIFSLNVTARAEDKKKCDLCDEVKVFLESARCDKCTAEKQCTVCAAQSKKDEEKYLCKSDKDKPCDTCTKALAANKCKFCAAKTYVVEHTYCCANCEKAGNEKAAKCDKCTTARARFVKIECKEKDCPNKPKK